MKRIAEVHQFEEHYALAGDVSPTNPMRVTTTVRYKSDENLAQITVYSDGLVLPTSLQPVGAPKACSIVHFDAVVTGRIKDLGAVRAEQIALYVLNNAGSVCDPANKDDLTGYVARYDLPQQGAPSCLRNCQINSCGVLTDVPEDSDVVVAVTDDPDGTKFTPAEPSGEMT